MTNMDEVIDKFDNASEAWRSGAVRKEVADAEYELISKAKIWKSIITLTFRDEIPPDIAHKRLLRLIRDLNKDLLGNHYTRLVNHSYFSYVVGIEYQQRGVIHFHMLVDKPINFAFLHAYWNDIAGFSLINQIQNVERSIRYVTKYIVKGGEVEHFFNPIDFYPREKPSWWID